MTSQATQTSTRPYERILGSYETAREGPTFVVTCGLHGNEPAGAEAARAVYQRLVELEPPLRGRYLAIAGNLKALERDVRYLDRDLNRMWTPQNVLDLRAQSPADDDNEQHEQREILGIFDDCESLPGEIVALDLHSSSADGAPFVAVGDTIRNRKVAFALPIPVILGLEEMIDGALLDYQYERGNIACAVEGGRHGAPETPKNLEAAIWVSLVAAGCLEATDLPDYDEQIRVLERAARGLPRVLEIRHRESLENDDRFVMEPGFETFDQVSKGQLLATKNGEEVRAKERGRMLLPLYQGQGNDGFFLCRRVARFWLRLSAWLRKIRFSRVLPILPGVRRHPTRPDAFIVDDRVARIRAVEIFHLLGFRRRRREGDELVFTRRPERARRRD